MSCPDPNHAAYLKGHALWKKQQFKEAALAFQVAIEEWPEDYQALWTLGDCYTELKKPRQAELAFRQALAVCADNDRVALTFNLGNALFDQKLYAEAVALYDQIPRGHHLSRSARRNAFLARERSA